MAVQHTSSINYQKRNRSSRSTLSIIKSFRKQPTPQPATLRPAAPAEPYQVFPGIWNTDATAKVFGYLDDDKTLPRKPRKERRPQCQHSPRPAPKGTPVFMTRLIHRYREAHHDDGTDDFSTQTHRRHVEARDRHRQASRDEAKQEREENQRRERRCRMITLSRDDELMHRGANPRTGIVSPCAVSDGSGETIKGNHIVAENEPTLRQTERTRSGKWKQDNLGWSLVESPMFSHNARGIGGKPGHAVSAQALQDKFVVDMPGVDNPQPAEMTSAQIEKFQEGFESMYRPGEGSAPMVHPDYFPCRRPWTPERTCIHLHRGQKIPRKEVGSRRMQRSGSTDTVIVPDQSSFSSPSTLQRVIKERRRVRTVTPSDTPQALSPQNPPFNRNVPLPYPDLPRDELRNRTTNTTKVPPRPMINQGMEHNVTAALATLGETGSTPPSPSLTLSQYLPRLNFLHPSHFASLATTYRRPAELLPPRLREVQNTKGTRSEFSGNDPAVSNVSGNGQRLPMQRQDGSATLPRRNFPSLDHEKKLNDVSQTLHPAAKNFPSKSMMNDAKPKYHNERIYKWIVPGSTEVDVDERIIGQSAAYNEVERLPELQSKAQSCAFLQRIVSPPAISFMPFQKRQVSRNSNVNRERLQNEARSIQIDGDLDFKKNRETPGVKTIAITRERAEGIKQPSFVSEDFPGLQITGSKWSAGHLNNLVDNQIPDEVDTIGAIEGLLREDSGLRPWKLIVLLGQKLCNSYISGAVHDRLMEMISHVLTTLHVSSPALKVFRKPNARIEEYPKAIKDVFLAAVYLLVLLNIFMVIRKILDVIVTIVTFLWLPLKTILIIARWFSRA